jgi:mannose-6-phosphate isomerase-like protein (cupin superfamily)
MMYVKDCRPGPSARVIDRSLLAGILHPDREGEPALNCSIARARVPAGEASLPHRLTVSAEVYSILAGEGIMHVGDETARVHPYMLVYISARCCSAHQEHASDLVFLCIVDPRWRSGDEELDPATMREAFFVQETLWCTSSSSGFGVSGGLWEFNGKKMEYYYIPNSNHIYNEENNRETSWGYFIFCCAFNSL